MHKKTVAHHFFMEGRNVNEESDRMMVLLQELATLKKALPKSQQDLIPTKRRKEITQEMKRLAEEKKKDSQ
jgi:hypothetical protein